LKNLLKILNYPLAAPSANVSTRLSPVKAEDVKEEFGNKISYILDGGKSKVGIESSILSLINFPKILRLGGLEISKIEKVLNQKIKIDINPLKIVAPGQSKLHYSPGIPLRMNAHKPRKGEAYVALKKINIKNYYLENNRFSRYFCIAWIITGDWKMGGSIAGIEVITKMFFYYFHERIWNKIKWGKKKWWWLS